MCDFSLHTEPSGTLLKAHSDRARTFNVEVLGHMADPILDETGVEIVQRMMQRRGWSFEDLREVPA